MIDTTNATTIKETCRAYQDSRTSDYEFRCIRYDAVIDKLVELGLFTWDSVLDIGCGKGEMCRRLRERGLSVIWRGVDGAIDGIDLNRDAVTGKNCFDWVVAIELLEHLHFPALQLRNYTWAAKKGVVITTPNPRTVDVLGCDPTHVSVVTPEMLAAAGYECEEVSLFKKEADSLIGWRKN